MPQATFHGLRTQTEGVFWAPFLHTTVQNVWAIITSPECPTHSHDLLRIFGAPCYYGFLTYFANTARNRSRIPLTVYTLLYGKQAQNSSNLQRLETWMLWAVFSTTRQFVAETGPLGHSGRNDSATCPQFSLSPIASSIMWSMFSCKHSSHLQSHERSAQNSCLGCQQCWCTIEQRSVTGYVFV